MWGSRRVRELELPYVGRWGRRTLYAARRNAAEGCVEMAQRRREVEEVDAFLEDLRQAEEAPQIPRQVRRRVVG